MDRFRKSPSNLVMLVLVGTVMFSAGPAAAHGTDVPPHDLGQVRCTDGFLAVDPPTRVDPLPDVSRYGTFQFVVWDMDLFRWNGWTWEHNGDGWETWNRTRYPSGLEGDRWVSPGHFDVSPPTFGGWAINRSGYYVVRSSITWHVGDFEPAFRHVQWHYVYVDATEPWTQSWCHYV